MSSVTAPSTRLDSDRILELGFGARDRTHFQREVLDLFDQRLGFTGAFLLGFEAMAGLALPAVVTAGMVSGYDARLSAESPRYQREIAPVKDHALKHGGVAVDTIVLGTAARKTRYYQDLVRPAGGGHSLLCFLSLRGHPQGLLMLGRETSRPFSRQDLDRVRDWRPALTLTMASFTRSPLANPLALSVREREIASYLLLGYTNREIACALGNSPHTVRNQLAALFRKAEVCTRAELVGRLLGH